ncbi:hypothetical protein [Aeromicrobium sp. CF3.5]|uniref:hypothetical protein n=1 Tax=Aeromicrobium sp. CF3.5 TaxID=3373078 RepID=UPI003EE7C07B
MSAPTSHAVAERSGADRRVWLWGLLLALMICAPLLRPGYVLTYDMVWVPHLDLDRLEPWGLGSALPRAVPSDAVVALLGSVVPAAVVQRVVLGAVFVIGAVGAARLVPTLRLPARLVAATFYVWNPFVAERLVLGQWPLLLGYAALPWLICALRSKRARWGPATLALAALALTPVGGVLGLLTAWIVGGRHGPVRLTALAGAVNAPWIVAGLLSPAGTRSDPAGAVAFSLQSDGPLGRLWSALSLGGIWNGDVVPASRGLWTTALLVLVGWAVMALGVRCWPGDGRGERMRLAVLAVVGLAVAVAGWVLPGFVQWWVELVPAGGLVRDGTRFLALLAPFSAMALAHGAARISEAIPSQLTSRFVAGLLVFLPIASLPDLALGVSGRLDPVQYPASWSQMREEIASNDVAGDLLVLPFAPYRAPEFNGGRAVLDPAGRFFDRTTVVNDDLVVSGLTIRGEDPRVDDLFGALSSGRVQPELLRQRGIGLVLVDTSAAQAIGALDTVARLQLVATHGDLVLFAAGDAEADSPGAGERGAVVAAWILASAALLAALGSHVVAMSRRATR